MGVFVRHGAAPEIKQKDGKKEGKHKEDVKKEGKQKEDGKVEGKHKYEIVAEEGVKALGFMPSAMPPERVFVSNLQPGTWATENGAQEGDQLIGADGKTVSKMDKKELKQVMKQ